MAIAHPCLLSRIARSNASAEAAEARGIRPRRVAPPAMRMLGDPHLLERRPVVRPASAQQQARRVRAHEAAIHLQSAPVRIARVPPAALVAMDAKPPAAMRRMRSQPADTASLTAPVPESFPRVEGRDEARAPSAHHHLPARSEEHTSELQSPYVISYAVFCL